MKPELLMPAGSIEKLNWAFHYGADAVYAGVPLLSLRARENEFNTEELRSGIAKAHSLGRKFYITANIFARNLKLNSFRKQLDEWSQLKPDAMIMSDPGLIAIVRERHPHIPIHLSVQANCMNWEAVQFWKNLGLTRIILSRELRLDEIKKIKDRVPDIELEAFVHGSICIAYSGRCLLSHYMSYRDANQGVCDNSCRYPYKIFSANEGNDDREFLLQDMRDQTELYPIEEDEHGTYIMNSKDLCLIEHLQEMRDAGVCSFKVEGRTKSEFYAAWVSKIYRKAIDDMDSQKPFDTSLLDELNILSHRGYHKGFMMGNPTHQAQNYQPEERTSYSKFLGIMTSKETYSHNQDISEFTFDVRNKLQVGQVVRVVFSSSEFEAKVLEIENLKGEKKEVVHSGMGKFHVKLTQPITEPCLILSSQ